MLEAAQKGDLEAVKMYEIAADELAMIVGSVYRKLKFGEGTLVSYSGGLFHAGEFILGPLREQLKTEGVRLCAPKYHLEGALENIYKKIRISHGRSSIKNVDFCRRFSYFKI